MMTLSGLRNACLLVLALTGVALSSASAGSDGARTPLAMQDGEPRLHATLAVHPEDVAEREMRIGVLIELEPGWHIYGADAGETGFPTTLEWAATGGSVRNLPWPATEDFGDAELGIEGQGYSSRVFLPARADFPNGPGVLRASLSLLACKDECIPAEAELELAVEAAPTSGRDAARALSAFGPAASGGSDGWLRALLFAFLGGLLLNLMPCVLPVLAIKALALADLSGSGPGEARRQGLAYGVGVLASLLLLAAVVAALRAAGAAVGWGFQFQEPIYVAALGAILVLFAMNLFGVFEIQAATGRLAAIGADATGVRRSFFDGLLTVALATPCSAPFLGTAVGFALGAAPVWIFPVFIAIGVGLALPLTLVGLYPMTARFLPRPGAWMQELRIGLGFILLATVVWLAWVLGRNAGIDLTARWLAWLLVVAFVGWRYGARQQRGHGTPIWQAVGAASLVLGLGMGAIQTQPVDSAASGRVLDARVWSRADVNAAVRIGRPAFVVFTADWCLTCKANERLALADPRIRAALEDAEFEVFEGDWTRRDADIARELARYGRSGVPFYAVLAPDSAPEILPEILTAETVLAALGRAEEAARVSRITRAAHAGSMQRIRGQ